MQADANNGIPAPSAACKPAINSSIAKPTKNAASIRRVVRTLSDKLVLYNLNRLECAGINLDCRLGKKTESHSKSRSMIRGQSHRASRAHLGIPERTARL